LTMQNPRVRKLIEDRTVQLSSDLMPMLRAQFEEFCRDVLGIVTSEFGDAIQNAANILPGSVRLYTPRLTHIHAGEIHSGPKRHEDGSLIDPARCENGALKALTTPPLISPMPSPAKPVPDLPPHPALAPAAKPTSKPAALSSLAAFEGVERLRNGTWRCVACGKEFPSRRGATTHNRKCKGASPGASPIEGQGSVIQVKRECIAPDCKNPSKGPRFHHLCEEHKRAPLKQVRTWQRARGKRGA